MFGIAVPGIMKELTGTISAFPSERVDQPATTDTTPESEVDELAARRRKSS